WKRVRARHRWPCIFNFARILWRSRRDWGSGPSPQALIRRCLLRIHGNEACLGAILHDVGELGELVDRQYEWIRAVRIAAHLLHPADLVAKQAWVAVDERLHLLLLRVIERLLE